MTQEFEFDDSREADAAGAAPTPFEPGSSSAPVSNLQWTDFFLGSLVGTGAGFVMALLGPCAALTLGPFALMAAWELGKSHATRQFGNGVLLGLLIGTALLPRHW